jgi:hypothetical protein
MKGKGGGRSGDGCRSNQREESAELDQEGREGKKKGTNREA